MKGILGVGGGRRELGYFFVGWGGGLRRIGRGGFMGECFLDVFFVDFGLVLGEKRGDVILKKCLIYLWSKEDVDVNFCL
jgi:hypothetical protein